MTGSAPCRPSRRRQGHRQPRFLRAGPQRPGPGDPLAARRARPTCRRQPRPISPSPGAGDFQDESRSGRNLHFGIREHASAAVSNGMALSKLRPYWSSFLTFSDYARGAIRLSALMEIPVLHIFTHDSIGVGEDGPTHQPVEQLASLRAIPGPARVPPGRRQRGDRDVARGGADNPRAGRARAVASGPADAGPHGPGAGVRCGAGRLCAGRQRQRARPT